MTISNSLFWPAFTCVRKQQRDPTTLDPIPKTTEVRSVCMRLRTLVEFSIRSLSFSRWFGCHWRRRPTKTCNLKRKINGKKKKKQSEKKTCNAHNGQVLIKMLTLSEVGWKQPFSSRASKLTSMQSQWISRLDWLTHKCSSCRRTASGSTWAPAFDWLAVLKARSVCRNELLMDYLCSRVEVDRTSRGIRFVERAES